MDAEVLGSRGVSAFEFLEFGQCVSVLRAISVPLARDDLCERSDVENDSLHIGGRGG
jgi:hypothetical protein